MTQYGRSQPGDDPTCDLWRHLDPWSVPQIEPARLAPQIGIGDLCLLVGGPGSGKTHLACSIALGFVVEELGSRVAGGALVPNLDEFRDGAIGIVDAENHDERWNGLCRRYLDGAGVGPGEYVQKIKVCSPAALRVGVSDPRDDAIRSAVHRLTELGIRLLIVDSLVPTFRPDDLNSPAWVIHRLAPFRAACREFGISAVILCHPARTPYGGKQSPMVPLGTTMQEAVADAVINVQPLSRGDRSGIKLTSLKSRRAPWIRRDRSVRAYFAGNGHYECTDARDAWPLEPENGAEPLTTKEQRVLNQLLVHKEGAATKLLAEQLQMSPDAVVRHLGALKAKDRVALQGGGPKSHWVATPEGGLQP